MVLFGAKIEEDSDFHALLSLLPRQRREGRTFIPPGVKLAYGLLAYGLRENFRIPSLPDIRYTENGKPVFSGLDLYFSLSHTKTHVLCAIGLEPVGCDIETRRAVLPRLKNRVLSPVEIGGDFFDLWVLKESYIKLKGRKDRPFRDIRFNVEGNMACFSQENVHGALYWDIPGCSAAVCTYGALLKPPFQMVSCERLYRTLEL